MADRGFTISERVWFYQAQLAIPAFIREKDQLEPIDIKKKERHSQCKNSCGEGYWTIATEIHYSSRKIADSLTYSFTWIVFNNH